MHRSLKLEHLEFEIGGDEIEPGEIGGPDHVTEAAPLLIVADRVVDGGVGLTLVLRADAEQGRKARLRIEVNGQHPVAAQDQGLRQMGGGGGLAGTALEVHAGDDLKVLALGRIAMRHVASAHPVDLIEMGAQGVDVGQGVEATAARRDHGLRDQQVRRQLADPAVRDAEDPRDLAGGEAPEGLCLGGREHHRGDLPKLRPEDARIVTGGLVGHRHQPPGWRNMLVHRLISFAVKREAWPQDRLCESIHRLGSGDANATPFAALDSPTLVGAAASTGQEGRGLRPRSSTMYDRSYSIRWSTCRPLDSVGFTASCDGPAVPRGRRHAVAHAPSPGLRRRGPAPHLRRDDRRLPVRRHAGADPRRGAHGGTRGAPAPDHRRQHHRAPRRHECPLGGGAHQRHHARGAAHLGRCPRAELSGLCLDRLRGSERDRPGQHRRHPGGRERCGASVVPAGDRDPDRHRRPRGETPRQAPASPPLGGTASLRRCGDAVSRRVRGPDRGRRWPSQRQLDARDEPGGHRHGLEAGAERRGADPRGRGRTRQRARTLARWGGLLHRRKPGSALRREADPALDDPGPPAGGGGQGRSDPIINRLTLGGAAFTLLFALLGWWAAERLADPLRALARAAGHIGKGSAHVPLPRPRGYLEITELTAALTDLLARLKERDRALADANADLEGRVAARTMELAEACDRAEAAQSRAEAGERAKSDFLATMSHEIRTPLNAIVGFGDLLRDDTSLSPEQRRCIDQMRVGCEVLTTVVNDILDYARIEADGVTLEAAPFSPRALVEETVALVAGTAERKGLGLHVESDAGSDHRVVGDKTRLRQVLLNLVNNAVKFTQQGSVTVAVTQNVTREGIALRVTVRDTGIGIPDEAQARLFTRFVQADSSTTRRFGGTGLGLAIAKGLIEAMGGTIGLESAPGEGSTFWFSLVLPAATACETRLDSPSAALAMSPPGTTPRQPAHLLVVEDGPVNREIAQMVLEAMGYRVSTACDGEEAVALVQAEPFDLVLMDIEMPVMDGITATRMIRGLEGRARDIPIVAMTAHVLPEQVQAMLAAGLNDHVGKPFDRAHLQALIERSLARAGEPADSAA
ncbi:hypothetical protein Lal_00043547 [Lupinus albus]|nr:hypothetical protein Lal_00043547 [Lupinus albus]